MFTIFQQDQKQNQFHKPSLCRKNLKEQSTIKLELKREGRQKILTVLRKKDREDLLERKRRNLGIGKIPSLQDNVKINSIIITTNKINSSSFPSSSSSSSLNYESSEQIIKILNHYASYVRSADIDSKLKIAHHVRVLLCREDRPPIKEIIITGFIPILLDFLQIADSPQLQNEAGWALTNFTAGATSKQIKPLLEKKSVDLLLYLVSSSHTDPELLDNLIWCIGNLVADPANEARDVFLKYNGLQIMVDLYQPEQQTLQILRHLGWIFTSFVRSPLPSFPRLSCLSKLLPTILYYTNDVEILSETFETLHLLCNGDDSEEFIRIQAVLDLNISTLIIQKGLMNKNLKVLKPALRLCGSLVSGLNSQIQTLLDSGMIDFFYNLLRDQCKEVRFLTCFIMSNIVSGTSDQLQMVINKNFISGIVHLANNDTHDIQKEAMWVLIKAVSNANVVQLQNLIKENSIPALVNALGFQDIEVLQELLSVLGNLINKIPEALDLIEEINGIEMIEALKNHKNDSVYDAAIDLIKQIDAIQSNNEENEEIKSFQFKINSNLNQYQNEIKNNEENNQMESTENQQQKQNSIQKPFVFTF